jgi:hypothetical protein
MQVHAGKDSPVALFILEKADLTSTLIPAAMMLDHARRDVAFGYLLQGCPIKEALLDPLVHDWVRRLLSTWKDLDRQLVLARLVTDLDIVTWPRTSIVSYPIIGAYHTLLLASDAIYDDDADHVIYPAEILVGIEDTIHEAVERFPYPPANHLRDMDFFITWAEECFKRSQDRTLSTLPSSKETTSSKLAKPKRKTSTRTSRHG